MQWLLQAQAQAQAQAQVQAQARAQQTMPAEPAPWRLEEALTADYGYHLDASHCIADVQTAYQHLQLFETASFGTVLRLDGALQCSEHDEFFYHEPLVHMAMARALHHARVLIIGGGDGGAAEEALKWPSLVQLDHVEIDAQVLALCAQHLQSVHRGVLRGSDARYRQHVCDGALWLVTAASQRLSYDVIVLDLTDAGGPSSGLYGADFYGRCADVLAPGGMLSLHVAAPWAQADAAARIIAQLRIAFAQVEPYLVSVPLSGGQWLMAACGNAPVRQMPSVAEIGQRLAQLTGPPLRAVDAQGLVAMLHLPPYLQQALAAPHLHQRPG